MTPTELLVGMTILVGIAGIVVPVLPGTLLVLGALLVWAVADGSGTSWAFFAAATTVLAIGQVVKYTIPGKHLKGNGVPSGTLVLGGLLGIVGFFVIPVVGLFVGFVLGVYLAELRRVGHDRARTSTVTALKATGLSILIELAAGLVAASIWAAGALTT